MDWCWVDDGNNDFPMANSDAVSPGLYADCLVRESYILFDATNASYFSLLYMCVCVCVCVCVCECVFWQISWQNTRETYTHIHIQTNFIYINITYLYK